MRPRIVVSGPDRGGLPAWWFTAFAVWRAGGWPVRATPRRGIPPASFSGLIVGGGADVEATLYGASPFSPPEKELTSWIERLVAWLTAVLRRVFAVKRAGVDPARDELELRLLSIASERGIPTLGICRGAQLLNVQRGGTLHQSLSDFYAEVPNPRSVLPRKWVDLAEGSELARIVGRDEMRVNSLHKQAIDRVGGALAVVARERNGVIQAVEGNVPLTLGVQWHPEYLPHRKEQFRIFRALVAASRALTAEKGGDFGLRRGGARREAAAASEHS